MRLLVISSASPPMVFPQDAVWQTVPRLCLLVRYSPDYLDLPPSPFMLSLLSKVGPWYHPVLRGVVMYTLQRDGQRRGKDLAQKAWLK